MLSAVVAPRNAYESRGFENGTEIEKAENTIYKKAFEHLQDAPFNATDRTGRPLKLRINRTERSKGFSTAWGEVPDGKHVKGC